MAIHVKSRDPQGSVKNSQDVCDFYLLPPFQIRLYYTRWLKGVKNKLSHFNIRNPMKSDPTNATSLLVYLHPQAFPFSQVLLSRKSRTFLIITCLANMLHTILRKLNSVNTFTFYKLNK